MTGISCNTLILLMIKKDPKVMYLPRIQYVHFNNTFTVTANIHITIMCTLFSNVLV